jgi:uncharacterized delta-60 repeat protein
MNARLPSQRRRRLFDNAIELLESRQLLSVASLEVTFGTGGKTVTDFTGQPNSAYSVALADGKILVAGSITTNLDADFALARYNANGTLDTTFGNGGLIRTDFGSTADEAYAISVETIDANTYKILLAGRTQTSSGFFDFAVARYNADGSLDNTFGVNHDGKAVVDFAGDFDQATSIALQGGKIVVGGSATVAFNSQFAMIRLDDQGILDSTFGANHDGKVITQWSGTFAETSGIAAQPDGKIILAGYAYNYATGNADAALTRYTVDGLLDPTFGAAQSGVVMLDFGRSDDRAQAVAVLPDGQILVGGYSNDNNGNSDFVLMRLSASGDVDTTFGGGSGVVLTDFGGIDQAKAMTLQPDGKIVLAGLTEIDGNQDFAIARFTSDGILDADFGPGGKITTDMGQDDSIGGVAIDADGGVIAVGSSIVIQSGAADFALARYAIPVNLPPVADAGGAYIAVEGSKLTLTGVKSMDPDGSIVSYEWDFNYDGNSFDVDATGMQVDFPTINGPGMYTVALRVTDNLGATSVIVTTTVRVDNAPPVASITGPGAVLHKQVATFNGSFFDPGILDTHEVSWDFGDGTVTGWCPGDSADALVAQHAYFKKGLYHVRFSVRDSDGAVSSACMDVSVQAGHISTGSVGGISTLTVNGTKNADLVSIRKAARGGAIEVTLNNVFQGLFQADRVIIFGSAGNDVIRVAPEITEPVEVFGGPGNDLIYGGVGDATLHGGKGNDKLFGGSGKNVLFGGAGNDWLEVSDTNTHPATLHGGEGNDVLIGGAGDDMLQGGQGNDQLDGRGGANRLQGGHGNDRFLSHPSDKIFDVDTKMKK